MHQIAKVNPMIENACIKMNCESFYYRQCVKSLNSKNNDGFVNVS